VQKAGLYRPLCTKNLEHILKAHLIRHYEFARKSRLAEALIETVLRELQADEEARGLPRVQPWQLVFRQDDQVALLTLFTDEDLQRSLRGAPLQDVRETIEERCLGELRTVWPTATLTDLRTILNLRARTRKGVNGPHAESYATKTPRDLFAAPPKLVDVHRFAKDVTRRKTHPADGVVSGPVLQKLLRELDEDYHLSPKLGRLLIEDLASLRAECLPRLDEMKYGQVLVLTTDSQSRIRESQLPDEQRLRPVIVTLFTEPERQALASESITYPEARAIQLHQLVRVHVEAYAQGGLLSYVDSQWLFQTCYTHISQAINHYEQTENVFVPTPGTVLDAGNKVTHKALIVRLYLDGKTTAEIARQTYHSEVAVDSYIGTFDQVALLHWYELSRPHMRLVLRRSRRLIEEYLRLVQAYFKDRKAIQDYLRSRNIKFA